MRVANFDMNDPNQNCPEEFAQVNITDPFQRLCGRSANEPGCSSMFFPVNGIQYSRVCGRVRAYQYGTPDVLHLVALGLESYYVDGVSITYDSPRNHIWTFAASNIITTGSHGCPCDTNDFQGTIPSFIGHDYFCETWHNTVPNFYVQLSDENPVWDGEGCLSSSTCCIFNNPPYFCQTLNAPTTEDIELRICGSDGFMSEDTPIQQIEMYVY